LLAQLAYQDRIAEFHARLRAFYYPYLFNDLRFGPQDFDSQPRFSPPSLRAEVPLGQLLGLLLMAAAILALGVAAAGRVRPTAG
jgi:ABC-2 type transport system permease protein